MEFLFCLSLYYLCIIYMIVMSDICVSMSDLSFSSVVDKSSRVERIKHSRK